jgi:SAM-dependent methyltransferase
MAQPSTIVFIFFFLISFIPKANALNDSTVTHKNNNLHDYLNQISKEQEEKTRILSHIINNPHGTFLDIGTGGDSVATIVASLPKGSTATIIAADIDADILQAIPERHPELVPYLQDKEGKKIDSTQGRQDITVDSQKKISEKGPTLKLIPMNAANMTPMGDCSLDGISASALTHEIFSYVPTKTGLDQFFTEIARVLKPGGVFIYRDPRWDDNPHQDSLLIIKNSLAKIFTVLFLPRFLDRTFSSRINYQGECVKPALYEKAHIRFNFFHKHCTTTKKVTLDELLRIPTCTIDFSKNISLEAPRGLISEIQRHYILFLKNIFITDIIDKNFFDKEYVFLDEMGQEQREILEQVLLSYQIKTRKVPTNLSLFNKIIGEKKNLFELIHNGLLLPIKDKEEVELLCQNLYHKGIDTNQLYITDNMLWIDAKLAALLYQGDNKSYLEHVADTTSTPYSVFEWLKREGEEFYFYKTTDEIITYVGQLTHHHLKGTPKEGYLLCPLDPTSIQHVTRNLYKSIVESHMAVIDINGNKQNILFDKNIIHFSLMKKEQALNVYKKIVNSSHVHYPKLKKWISHDIS